MLLLGWEFFVPLRRTTEPGTACVGNMTAKATAIPFGLVVMNQVILGGLNHPILFSDEELTF